MRVLILGARGQLGSRLAHAFRTAGYAVMGTTRLRDVAAGRTFDPWTDDWSQLGACDVLVNAIGAIEERGADTFERVHVELAQRLADADVSLGRPRVLQISALGARADHPSRFLATKAAGDRVLLEALGERVVVLRPSIVCTTGTRLVRALRTLARHARWTRGIVPVPRGLLGSRLQPIAEDDFVNALLAQCSASNGGVFELGGAEVHAMRDLVSLALAARGLSLHPIELPKSWLRFAHPLAPRALVSREELILLGEDNVLPEVSAAGRRAHVGGPTLDFFRRQLGLAPAS